MNEYQLKSISFNYSICGIWKIFNNTRQRKYGLNIQIRQPIKQCGTSGKPSGKQSLSGWEIGICTSNEGNNCIIYMLGSVVGAPLKRKIKKISRNIFIKKIMLQWNWLSSIFCIHMIWYWWFMVFNATFNNISVTSWRSVLLVEYPKNIWYPVLLSSWYTRTSLWGKDIDICQSKYVCLYSSYNYRLISYKHM
jgi:hypothetical protein